MRQNILKLIGEAQDATNVIILTHNIDFIFLQSAVVPLLRKCGHPTLTVFADADCAFESFKRHGQWIDGIGKRYRVVPVAMNPGFRFHPKAMLLSSQEKATLLVGSGNMGFGGWRENGEVWTCFNTDIDGGSPFAAFHQYLNQIIQRVPLNDSVISEVEEAFDAGTRSWAVNLGEPDFLAGKVGQGKSLIDLFLEIVGQDGVEQLTICTPYFDENGEMLKQLAKITKPLRTRVLVQGSRPGLLKNTAASMPPDIAILPVDFRRDEGRSSFLHAKFYAFERSDNVTVLVGSANCSRAALEIPGSDGNAELMAIQKMTSAEFQENYLDELDFLQGEPQFQEEADKPIEGSSIPVIRILAARFEPGELRLGYNCSNKVKITACLVDGFAQQLTNIDLSVALASWALAVQKSAESPEYALFALACAESIAKLPWLWDAYRLEDIANGLKKALIHTRTMEPDDNEAWGCFRSRWKELIQRGYTLGELEQNLSGLRLIEVKELVTKDRVERGELLWQGPIGFCVAGESCSRSGTGTIDVLCLQSPNRHKTFAVEYLVPLDGLLSAEAISPSNNLGEREKRVLKDFIDELSEGFNRHFDYS